MQKFRGEKNVCRARLLIRVAAGALACTMASYPAQALAQSASANIDIPAQPLAQSLMQLSRQANVSIVADSSLTRNRRAPAIRGAMSVEQALDRLLAQSGLAYRANGRSFIVERRQAGANSGEGQAGSAAAESASAEQQEIVVTGTNIRGGTVASPTQSYTHRDISRSGAVSLQDFVRQIPQNFGGGASEISVGSLAGSSQTSTGAGINLRGLGNDSTLLLVNGHRLAPGGLDGSFVNIAMIPTSAIERVDIVLDGASAIYGSDAVGGVVNVRLRSSFDGAESRLRYTNYANSDAYELNASQTLATGWQTGSVLVSYDFYKRTPINADERPALTTWPMPFTLTPSTRRHSVVVAAHQDLGAGIRLDFDGFYTDQKGVLDSTTSGAVARSNNDTETWNAGLALTVPLSDAVTFTATGAYGNNDGFSQTTRAGVIQPSLTSELEFYSIEGKIDASLFELPAGPVRLAAGVQYRHESLYQNLGSPLRVFDAARRNLAGFAELDIPILGSAGASGAPLLRATLAGRVEDISAIGTTFNPKIGLVLNPTPGLRLRGTYGTSFKAPRLLDLNPEPSSITTWALAQSSGPPANGLIVFGGNPDLRPEEADTFTAGFDWTGGQSNRFRASGSFYYTNYRNRVTDLNTFATFTNVLLFEDLLQGSGIIQRNPSAATVQQLYANPRFSNAVFPFPANSITVLVDYRVRNVSSIKTSGIDFEIGYQLPLLSGNLDFSLSGNYTFYFNNRIIDQAPIVDLIDTTFNPPELRAVGRIGYISDDVDVSFTGRYVNPYTNTRVTPNTSISSWLTFDLSAILRFSTGRSQPNDLEVAFGANNIFNRNPPFVQLPFRVLFDGTNANPYRRSVYLAVTKRW